MYHIIQRFIFFWVSHIGTKKQKLFFQKRIDQNFSFLTKEIQYWIHASSVGEVNLLDGFIKECLLRLEGDILLTVFTDTGKEIAQKKYEKEKRIHIYYFPLDDQKNIEKILEQISLRTLFIVETELWPNLIKTVSKEARVVLINGRISERSFKRYDKISFLLKKRFDEISYFYIQTEEDKKRFLKLGAKEESCEVVGNLKFDIEVSKFLEKEKEDFKKKLGFENRKIWVAGSTRTGEYPILVNSFLNLEKEYILILVPRHLERVNEIRKYLEEKNLSYQSYSEERPIKDSTQILLVDAMGVLRKFYAIADVAFVGGTLVNIGGHSLLEPLSYGKTPIFGPYIQNVKEIAGELLKRGLAYQIQKEEELVKAILQIEKQKKEIEKEIEEFLVANRKVANKILEREEVWRTEKKK